MSNASAIATVADSLVPCESISEFFYLASCLLKTKINNGKDSSDVLKAAINRYSLQLVLDDSSSLTKVLSTESSAGGVATALSGVSLHNSFGTRQKLSHPRFASLA